MNLMAHGLLNRVSGAVHTCSERGKHTSDAERPNAAQQIFHEDDTADGGEQRPDGGLGEGADADEVDESREVSRKGLECGRGGGGGGGGEHVLNHGERPPTKPG